MFILVEKQDLKNEIKKMEFDKVLINKNGEEFPCREEIDSGLF